MLYVITILPDPLVNGILVQLPLPGHLDEQEILERISQTKVRTYRWIGVKYDGLDWIIKTRRIQHFTVWILISVFLLLPSSIRASLSYSLTLTLSNSKSNTSLHSILFHLPHSTLSPLPLQSLFVALFPLVSHLSATPSFTLILLHSLPSSNPSSFSSFFFLRMLMVYIL